MSKRYFPYSERELDYLAAHDAALGTVIREVGRIRREIKTDVFAALVGLIIAQQISGKAAAAVEAKLVARIGKPTPQLLASLTEEDLAACGMSRRKAGYILGAAQAALNGQVDFAALSVLSDAEVIAGLTGLSGVGRWTAEMLLIFSLARPDVISYKDFGIRKGMRLLYGLENLSRADFVRLSEAYHPYASIASFYLWHIANNA